jgi:hypothetical protein
MASGSNVASNAMVGIMASAAKINTRRKKTPPPYKPYFEPESIY